jgi:iron complex outermembrane receptor protein
MPRSFHRWVFASAATAALLTAESAIAQDATAAETTATVATGDIVVTAQRRSESIMRTPVAISAITGEALVNRGIRVAADLQIAVPAISINNSFGLNKTQIRGIGLVSDALGVDSASAFYINGNVISRPSAQILGFYDLERVEVLRGPQGTLYGRNATAGLVNIITRKPTVEASGYLNASYGNYNAINIEGAISGKLDEAGKILARVAVNSENRDGFGTNLTTGEEFDNANHIAVRGTVELRPSEDVTVTIIADHSKMDDRTGNHVIGAYGTNVLTGVRQGGRNAGYSRDVYNDTNGRYFRKNTGISGEIAANIGDVTIKSLTAYRDFRREDQNDIDGTDAFNADLSYTERSKTFSQEIQLGYDTDRFKGVAGFFYFYEDDTGALNTDLNIDFYSTSVPVCNFDVTCRFGQGGTSITNSYAGFAQGTYEVSEQFSLTAGMRYTSETKELRDGVAQSFLTIVNSSGKKTWNALTPRVGFEFKPSSSTLLFGSVSKGFRAGSFLLGVVQPPVNPETLWSYELGVKSRFLDNRGTISVTGFYSDYSDLQLGRLLGTTAILENAGQAEVYGLELESNIAVTPQFSVDATASYIHAELKEFSTNDELNPTLGLRNLAGNQLPNAPRWAATLGMEYKVPLENGAEVAFRVDGNWRSRVFFDFYNRPENSQDDYAKANASITYRTNDNLSISAFVRNLTDKTTLGGGSIGSRPIGFPVNVFFDDPRTYGVRVGLKF